MLKKRKRDDNYWLSAAWKRLQRFLKYKPDTTISERGLVKIPLPFGTGLLLQAEEVKDFDSFLEWSETVFPIYRTNYRVMYGYFAELDGTSQPLTKPDDCFNKEIHPELRAAIDAHRSLN